MQNSTIKIVISLIGMVFLGWGIPNEVNAQMFSVESNGAQPTNEWNQSIYLSGSLVDFSYTGGEDAQFAGNYEFNSPTIGLRYEIPGLDIYMNVGGALTGMDNHSYVNVGAQLYQPFRLYGTDRFQLYAPLQLHSDFTRVVSERQQAGIDQFQQSMLAPGGGLMYGFEISDRIDYTGVGIAEYGFSFSAGNTFTGQVLGIQAQQRLSIANIFGTVGLALGYDLQFRRYNVEIDQYDYNLLSHHLYLGVNF